MEVCFFVVLTVNLLTFSSQNALFLRNVLSPDAC